MKQKLSETNVVYQCIDWLNWNGFVAWRNNIGGANYQKKDGSVGLVMFGKKGSSDIFAMQKGTGRFAVVEVKLPDKLDTVTPAQQEFINMVNFFGGIGIITTGVDHLAEEMKKYAPIKQ